MAAIGHKARVLSSSGFHSKEFIGHTGVAVMKLSAGKSTQWVIRFSSSLSGGEEGLYADTELVWLPVSS